MLREKFDLIKEVLRSGNLSSTHGNNVELFEHRFAKYIGSKYAIAVNSGTAALHTALLSLGIGPGDEVICPAWTFISTVSTILMCGATPVFVDIKKDSFNIDSKLILDKLTDKTKAVIVVHLAGIPMDITDIGWILSDNGISIVEDACQALGAEIWDHKVGTIGDVGVFSFYPSKIITTGEGGMIVTDHKRVEEDCRLIRHHGQSKKYYAERLGFNYRMTEIQGALGLVELKNIDYRVRNFRERYKVHKYKWEDNDLKFPIIPKSAKIAPTYAMAWSYRSYEYCQPKEIYTPLYKLPLFKQDIKLKWTEHAYKHGIMMNI